MARWMEEFLKWERHRYYLILTYLVYLVTAIALSSGGSSTVHIYTQTIHVTIQNKQYIEQHNNYRTTQQLRVRAVARLG